MLDGAVDAPAAPDVVIDARHSLANVLSNQGCTPPPRSLPQGVVAHCSRLAAIVGCVTQSSTRRLVVMLDGAVDAPAAPDVVLDARHSLANVLSNQGCMPPQQ